MKHSSNFRLAEFDALAKLRRAIPDLIKFQDILINKNFINDFCGIAIDSLFIADISSSVFRIGKNTKPYRSAVHLSCTRSASPTSGSLARSIFIIQVSAYGRDGASITICDVSVCATNRFPPGACVVAFSPPYIKQIRMIKGCYHQYAEWRSAYKYLSLCRRQYVRIYASIVHWLGLCFNVEVSIMSYDVPSLQGTEMTHLAIDAAVLLAACQTFAEWGGLRLREQAPQ